MSNKSQMEIMGLAIIVVIVIIAITIFVGLSLNSEPANFRGGFISAELSNNIVYTYLDTASAACSGYTMTELLQDCVQSNAITCDDGKDSCEYASSVAKLIFERTIEKWKYKYYFSAKLESNAPFIQEGKQCPGSKIGKPYSLPTEAGTITVTLDICSG